MTAKHEQVISVRLPKELVDYIDGMARRGSTTRTDVISRLLFAALADRGVVIQPPRREK